MDVWNLILEWNKRICIEMGAVFHAFHVCLHDALITKLPQFHSQLSAIILHINNNIPTIDFIEILFLVCSTYKKLHLYM